MLKTAPAFSTRYGTGILPAGTWSGALAPRRRNRFPSTLLTAGQITSVTYSDATPWPSRADGDGSSLELINPAGLADDASNWRSSFTFHGSPGTAGPDNYGPILVNEVLAHTDLPLRDSIELVNPTAAPVDVSGWFLSDSKTDYRKFRLPAGTIIPAGGYQVFDETHFNAPAPVIITGYSGTLGAAPVTVTSNAHGLVTGDAVTLSGYGGYSLYNGSWQVTVTGSNTFTLPTVFSG